MTICDRWACSSYAAAHWCSAAPQQSVCSQHCCAAPYTADTAGATYLQNTGPPATDTALLLLLLLLLVAGETQRARSAGRVRVRAERLFAFIDAAALQALCGRLNAPARQVS
jgi:hypothetical protein